MRLLLFLLPSLAFAQLLPPPSSSSSDAGAGITWTTALDCDFTSLPYQQLTGGDGTTVTLCGIPWTIVGTGGPRGYEEVDGGLFMSQMDAGFANNTPYCGAAAPRVDGIFTGLKSPLSTVIPGYTINMPVRLYIYWSGGFSGLNVANNDGELAGIIATAPTLNNNLVGGFCDGFFQTLQSGVNTHTFVTNNVTQGTSSVVMDAVNGAAPYVGANEFKTIAEFGVSGGTYHNYLGTWDGGTFSNQTWYRTTGTALNGAIGAFNDAGYSYDVSNMNVVMGVGRADSGTGLVPVKATLGRIRIDYQNIPEG